MVKNMLTFGPKQAVLYCTITKFRLKLLSVHTWVVIFMYLYNLYTFYLLYVNRKGPKFCFLPQADEQHFLNVRHPLSLIIS